MSDNNEGSKVQRALDTMKTAATSDTAKSVITNTAKYAGVVVGVGLGVGVATALAGFAQTKVSALLA